MLLDSLFTVKILISHHLLKKETMIKHNAEAARSAL